MRASAVLAAVMLGVGIAAGAAIGPGPEASLAGGAGIAQKLPALIAAAAARGGSQTPTPAHTTTSAPPTVTPQATPAAAQGHGCPAPAQTTPAAAAPTETPVAGGEQNDQTERRLRRAADNERMADPALGRVLHRSAGQGAAAPYISGQLIPKGTFLPAGRHSAPAPSRTTLRWSKSRASSAQRRRCCTRSSNRPAPKAPRATCGAGTPGALTAADEFLKATLATITADDDLLRTRARRRHVRHRRRPGRRRTARRLVAARRSPPSHPPACCAALAVRQGRREPAATFNPTSPKQSLEKLLH